MVRPCVWGVLWLAVMLGPQAAVGGAPSRSDPDKGDVPACTLAGTVVDESGKPVPGAAVRAATWFGDTAASATADEAGRFTFEVRMSREAATGLSVSASVADRSLLGFHRSPMGDPDKLPDLEGLRIALEPARAATVKVIDAEGKPVERAQVSLQLGFPLAIGPRETNADGVATFQVPKSDTIASVIALKDHEGFDYQTYGLARFQEGDQLTSPPEFPFEDGQTLVLDGVAPLTMEVKDAKGRPLPDASCRVWLLRKESRNDELNLSFFPWVRQMADATGSLTIAWFPTWQTEPVSISSSAEGYARERSEYNPSAPSDPLTVRLQRLVPLRGRLTLPDGTPAPDVTVAADGAGYSMFAEHGGSVRTDEAGRYELLVAPYQTYMLTVADKRWAAPAQSGFVVLPEQDVPDHDFTLRPATRVHGRVLNRATSEPVAGAWVALQHRGIPLSEIGMDLLPNPDNQRTWVCPMRQLSTLTDTHGRFEFFVGEGGYSLLAADQPGETLAIADEPEKEVELRVDVQAQKILTGSVSLGDTGTPVADVRVSVHPARPNSFMGQRAMSTADGSFSVETLAEPAKVRAIDKEGRLGAIAELAADQTTVALSLLELGRATGTLLTDDGSQPAAGVTLQYGVWCIDRKSGLRWHLFQRSVTTDPHGAFTLTALVPGWDYKCTYHDVATGVVPTVATVNVQPGEARPLGDIRIPKPETLQPYVPPTLKERTLAAFDVAGTPLERFESAKQRVQEANQNLLVVFGDPEGPRIEELMRLRFEDKAFRPYADDYRFMAISTAADRLEAARALATSLDMPASPGDTELLMAVVDRDGEVVARLTSDDVCADGSLSKDLLLAELDKHKTTPLDAHDLLREALAKARQENKRVLLQETATWCGPCQMLSQWLVKNRQWETDYVWVKMDHRWTGAEEIMKDLRGDAVGGIPWIAILDADGTKLATSNEPDSGSNIGFPSGETEQRHFRRMLETTCQRMTPAEISALLDAASDQESR
jgi:hypothetical protein